MSAQDAADRNLPASAKKIRRARADGNVPRSRDLGHFAALAVATALLFAAAPRVAAMLQQLLAQGLSFDHRVLASPAAAGEIAGGLFLRGLVVVVMLGGALAATGVASSVALGGWNMSLKAVQPDFSRLNPLAGLGRMFNKQALVNSLKAIVLAIALGVAGGLYLKNHLGALTQSLASELPEGMRLVVTTVGAGFLSLLLVLGLWALVDVPLQKKQWSDRLKMSREELRQEQKEAEGSSEVKAKIKVKMRQLARRRMMQAVPAADIVVMNPTHYAVALKYDEGAMGAPRVVAKGTDRLALRIRELARESGVPVLQAPPLARALYAHVELDGEVPAMLFAAVAQVLAWVYQMRRTPLAPTLPPEVSVPDELDPLKNPALARQRQRRRPAAAAGESA